MEKFSKLFAEIVEMPVDAVKLDIPLIELEMWDSIAAVSFMAMVDSEFGIKLTADQIRKATTVNDLYKLASAAD